MEHGKIIVLWFEIALNYTAILANQS